MNFFKDKLKIGLFTTTLLALFILPARASAIGIGEALIGALTTMIEYVMFAINYVTGMLVTFGGGLVNFSLDLNEKIVSDENQLVELGWQITRDVANLGFVLIIIVIALATIVRYREYGAKKFLPKLIAAALIVNFSLVIGFSIIGFADTFTNFFINSQIGGADKVGEAITASFAPQKFYTDDLIDSDQPVETPDGGFGVGAAAFNSLAGMAFAIVFQFIAFATLLALSMMLIIRFVYLSILLIVAPLALLMWASPGLQHLFKKWWDKFLKWTFFAPAVSFFVYLSLLSLQKMSTLGDASGVGQGFEAGLQNIIIQGSQMIIVSGLMLGGLIAAESMSIHGASSAMGGVKSAWDKIKGKASGARGATWRKTKQWAGSTINKKDEDGKSLADKTQDAAAQGGWKGVLAKTFARPVANLSKATNEDVMKEHDDALKDKSVDQVRAVLNTTRSTPRKIAALNKLVKEGKIDKEDASKYLTEDMKETYERFGKGKEFKELEKKSGMSMEMNVALQAGELDKFKEESDKYIKRYKKKDVKDMPFDKVFEAYAKGKGFMNLTPEQTKNLAINYNRSIATQNSAITPSILPNMGPESMEKFHSTYTKAIKREMSKLNEGSDEYKELKKALENVEKSIGNYAISGFYADSSGSGGGGGNSSSKSNSDDNKKS